MQPTKPFLCRNDGKSKIGYDEYIAKAETDLRLEFLSECGLEILDAIFLEFVNTPRIADYLDVSWKSLDSEEIEFSKRAFRYNHCGIQYVGMDRV